MTSAHLKDLDCFTDEEFTRALARTLERLLLPKGICPVAHPDAVLLGGQSGAGKTTLHKLYRKQYENNVIIINGDEYRKSHPHFAELGGYLLPRARVK